MGIIVAERQLTGAGSYLERAEKVTIHRIRLIHELS